MPAMNARKEQLLAELAALVLGDPRPSAYLSAMYECSEEQIEKEIERQKAKYTRVDTTKNFYGYPVGAPERP